MEDLLGIRHDRRRASRGLQLKAPRRLRFARRSRTVHRHAVDLLELGQVLVQHLGAGLERRARRLVALVLAAPLAADACVTSCVARVRASACMRTPAPRGRTPWLRWPKGHPAARRSPAGAPTARRRRRRQLMRGRPCTWCFATVLAMQNAESCQALRGVLGPCGAVRAVNLRRWTWFYLCHSSVSGLELFHELAICILAFGPRIGSGLWKRINRFRAPRCLPDDRSCRCFQSRGCSPRVRLHKWLKPLLC